MSAELIFVNLSFRRIGVEKESDQHNPHKTLPCAASDASSLADVKIVLGTPCARLAARCGIRRPLLSHCSSESLTKVTGGSPAHAVRERQQGLHRAHAWPVSMWAAFSKARSWPIC